MSRALTLFNNPLIVSHARMQLRSGMFTSLGFSALAGALCLIYYFDFDSAQKGAAAAGVYAFLMSLQGVILYFAVFSTVFRAVLLERENGLLEQNTLSPMSPGRLTVGYGTGPIIKYLAAALTLGAFGLIVTLDSHLSPAYWLQTQVVLFLATPFFSLTAILMGTTAKKGSNHSALLALGFLGLWAISQLGAASLGSFIIPLYAIGAASPDFIQNFRAALGPELLSDGGENSLSFFSYKLSPFFLNLVIHLSLGFVLWRLIKEKLQDFSQTLFRPINLYLLYFLIVFFQSGLIYGDPRWGLALLHITFLVIAWFLMFSARIPFKNALPHLEVQRHRRLGKLLLHSLPVKSAIFCFIATVFLTLVASSTEQGLKPYWWLAVLNFYLVLMFLAFWSEICDLNFKGHAAGVFRIGLAIYFLVPFLLTVVSPTIAPLLTPWGFSVHVYNLYMSPPKADASLRWVALIFHLAVIAGTGFFWFKSWKALQSSTSSSQPESIRHGSDSVQP